LAEPVATSVARGQRFGDSQAIPGRLAPTAGEHGDEILAEAGLSDRIGAPRGAG